MARLFLYFHFFYFKCNRNHYENEMKFADENRNRFHCIHVKSKTWKRFKWGEVRTTYSIFYFSLFRFLSFWTLRDEKVVACVIHFLDKKLTWLSSTIPIISNFIISSRWNFVSHLSHVWLNLQCFWFQLSDEVRWNKKQCRISSAGAQCLSASSVWQFAVSGASHSQLPYRRGDLLTSFKRR